MHRGKDRMLSHDTNSAAESQPPAAAPQDWRARAAQVLTTEHFALQSARSATIADTSGRANLYLGSVSLALVALALVGQASEMGPPFFVFGLVLFPTLLFLGLATFARVNESTAEDLLLARGINRIRHFYLEFVPETEPYFILSAHDDLAGVFRNMGIRSSPWQLFLTTAGMIGVINSVVAGVVAGLVASVLGWSIAAALGIGAVVFVLSAMAHYRAERSFLVRGAEQLEVRFPSPRGAVSAGSHSATGEDAERTGSRDLLMPW
jgi:hypothetical protein